MTSYPISIISTGARTPVGLASAPAAAAVRAGICRIREHPFMIDQTGNRMPSALDGRLDAGVGLVERLLTFANAALHESGAPLSRHGQAFEKSVPIYLGLPEPRPGFSQADGMTIKAGIVPPDGLPFVGSEMYAFTDGHAAGFSALAAAVAALQHGRHELCLVGGVDSYCHPDTMEWLDKNRQLVGTVARSAFVPGEGAGFCLLATERARTRHGWNSLGRVIAVATGLEEKRIKSSEVCLGEGLSDTLRRTLGALSPMNQRIDDIFCDINGERYRGEEWGFTCLRMQQYIKDPTAYHAPTDCWGDVGAASGPLFIMLACQSAARGYAKGPQALLWASSEAGLRGAAVLEFEV